MRNTEEKIYMLLAESLEKNRSEIQGSMEPLRDLDMDSIRLMDFILKLEDAFGISFNDFAQMSHHMSSVDELVHFLGEKIGGG